MSAEPFFIVSSGRSGTAMLHKALSAVPDVEMHHEYMVQITQPLAVRRYLGLIDAEETRRLIGETTTCIDFDCSSQQPRSLRWP